MIVTVKAMDKYRNKLRAVNKKCADEVQAYMVANNFQIDDNFISYAHSLTTLYGEAAAELSCQLYDEISTYWADAKKGKRVPPAVPAEVAAYGDVAKTIQGTAKKSLTQIPEGVATLVKRAAEDTTLKNALRDGAEFAWIPNGDTCAFCRMIASNGWRKISAKALKNGHAEHIHPNCDCSYVARPSGSNIDFEGYDPEALYHDYQELGLDGMRRKLYAENKDKILAQQRLAYAKRKGLNIDAGTEKTFVSTYKDVSTIKEAEEYARTFVDTDHFGSVGISYQGVDVEVANTVNKALDDFYRRYDVEKFGGVVAPAGNTKLGKMIDGATAAYSPVRNSFLLNRKSMKTMEIAKKAFQAEKDALQNLLLHPERYDFSKLSSKVKEVVKKSMVSGRSTVPDSVESALWHELGHSLERNIKKLPNADILKENMGQYAEKISGYATTDFSEYIAESFASYNMGEGIIDPLLEEAFKALERR